MSALKLLFTIGAFVFSTGCNPTSTASTNQPSKENLISIAIEEARKHEDWDEFISDGHILDASEVNSSFQRGISVVTVTGLPFGPGREASVFIGLDGKVVGYVGGR